MKNVITVARREVEYWIKAKESPSDCSWALISIWEDVELATFQNMSILKELGCCKILSMKFADITAENKWKMEKVYNNLKLFDKQDAYHIINFVDDVKDKVDKIIVHCAAGVSRSGATGLFICKYLGLDEEVFRRQNKYICPNFHVLDILNETSGIKNDYVNVWKNRIKEGSKNIDIENLF